MLISEGVPENLDFPLRRDTEKDPTHLTETETETETETSPG